MLDFEKVWNSWQDAEAFSGVVSVRDEQGVIFEKCQGFRIFSEQLPNNANTAFGIASGTKLFTALAVCKLIDGGKLSLNDKLWDLLPYDLGQINRNVTV
ncbi:MAG: serine hydrolase, partial [Christensenellales bacterium]